MLGSPQVRWSTLPTAARCTLTSNWCASRTIIEKARGWHKRREVVYRVVFRGWTAANFHGEDDWCLRLDRSAIEGFKRAVADAEARLEKEYGRPGIRTSKTNAAFDFHTDSPSRLAGHTPDYVALLVLRTAKSGGESALVSAGAVHEIIRQERQECLARLYRPFWVDRRAELPPGEEPVLAVPVFRNEGSLVVRYLRFYIRKGHEVKKEPLSESDLTALDFFDSVMQRSAMALLIRAERGDIQIVKNKTLLHSRTAFEDHPESELKRHYLRMWIEDASGTAPPLGTMDHGPLSERPTDQKPCKCGHAV